MTPEVVARLAAFAAVLAALVGWELALPWRRVGGRGPRWRTNLALAALDAALVRLVLPMGLIGVATAAEARGWGLLPRLGLPGWAAGLVAVLALDLLVWTQHAAFHKVPVLWRLHRVHHADEHLDATTGVRFHPGEALLSLGWKSLLVVALGAPPIAAFVFEVVLNATSLFNHANVALPPRVDRWLRWLVVTPAMHRVHHSRLRSEADSNYGFNVPWWDHLFRTYRAEAAAGEALQLGVADAAGEGRSLRWSLLAPFRRPPASGSRTAP